MAANENAIQPASQEEKFLTEKQLLTRLPISRRTAFNWIQKGKLPVVKIGRRKLYHWKSVEEALLRIQKGAM
jgi:predicted site-specific integrase-resolvase